jgi:serine O-acetyltransferase
MKMSLPKNDLLDYLVAQLNSFFPDKRSVSRSIIDRALDHILERTSFCFRYIKNKYFYEDNEVIFNHMNADQYAMFLYFVANTLYRDERDIRICEKIYMLNKVLHGIDVYFEVELPEIFHFVHPIGTVLGRGQYSNYLLIYQRCGIGSNHDIYPVLKPYVTLRPGSSVLGKCLVGENCTIAAGSLLLDRDLDDNTVYIGNPRDFITKRVEERLPIWISEDHH